jgi:hypothetical protein
MRKDIATQPQTKPNDVNHTVELVVEMVRTAIEKVPAEERDALKRRLSELLASPWMPKKGGPVLNNIVHLFQTKTAWTAAEIREALAANGNEPNQHAVYSALQYLGNKQIIERYGYGQYRLRNGAGLVTSDKLREPDLVKGGVMEN